MFVVYTATTLLVISKNADGENIGFKSTKILRKHEIYIYMFIMSTILLSYVDYTMNTT